MRCALFCWRKLFKMQAKGVLHVINIVVRNAEEQPGATLVKIGFFEVNPVTKTGQDPFTITISSAVI